MSVSPPDPARHHFAAFNCPPPALRIVHWLREGFLLWRCAPWKMAAFLLIGLLVEAGLQWIPWAGTLISKVIAPMFGLGLALGLDTLAHGGRLSFSLLILAFRRRWWRQALGATLLSTVAVFGLQLSVMAALHGRAAVDLLLLGHLAAHRDLLNIGFRTVLLLAGVPTSMGLWLVGYALFLERAQPWAAVCRSVGMMVGALPPATLLLLLNLAFSALLAWSRAGFILLFVFAPWMSAVSYAMWRDLGGATAARPALTREGECSI